MRDINEQLKNVNIELHSPISIGDLDDVYQGIQHLPPFGSRPVVVRIFNREACEVDWLHAAITKQISSSLQLCSSVFPCVITAGILEGGQIYIVSEFITGELFFSLISENHTFKKDQLVNYFITALDMVHGLHSQPASAGSLNVHGGLSPSRLLIDTNAHRAHCIDSGIQEIHRYATEQDPPLAFGELKYMSPEQINGELLTPASDVFTLGLILYELVCGPRTELESLPVESLVDKALDGQHVDRFRLKELAPNVEAVLLKSLEIKPENRFETAGDFADALRGCLELAAQKSKFSSGKTLELSPPSSIKDEIPVQSLLKKPE